MIVLNKVNRTGMCVDEDEDEDEDVRVSDRRRSQSFSNRSLPSNNETYRRKREGEGKRREWNVVMFTCVMEECGKMCCI